MDMDDEKPMVAPPRRGVSVTAPSSLQQLENDAMMKEKLKASRLQFAEPVEDVQRQRVRGGSGKKKAVDEESQDPLMMKKKAARIAMADPFAENMQHKVGGGRMIVDEEDSLMMKKKAATRIEMADPFAENMQHKVGGGRIMVATAATKPGVIHYSPAGGKGKDQDIFEDEEGQQQKRRRSSKADEITEAETAPTTASSRNDSLPEARLITGTSIRNILNRNRNDTNSVPQQPIAIAQKDNRRKHTIWAIIIAIIIIIIVAVVIVSTIGGGGKKDVIILVEETVTEEPTTSTNPTTTPSFIPTMTLPTTPTDQPTVELPEWIKLGQDIDGIREYDRSGESLSISSSGYRVAIGAANWDDGPEYLQTGQVQVWDYVRDTDNSNLDDDTVGAGYWYHAGDPIVGDMAPDQKFGDAVALSGDGMRLAVLSNNTSLSTVHVYTFKEEEGNSKKGGRWELLGNALTNVGNGCHTHCLSMNENGNTLFVGTTNNSTVDVYQYVDLFKLDNTTNDVFRGWVSKGKTISGVIEKDQFGLSVDATPDGNTFIAGAPGTESGRGGGEEGFEGSNQTGYAQVYTYNTNKENWEKKGSRIRSRDSPIGDQEGWDVSISRDGNVVAVSAILNDGEGDVKKENAGRVQIYRYDTTIQDWKKVGQSIIGEKKWDNSGWSISLSGDGTIVIVGAIGNRGRPESDTETPINYNHGHARAFRYYSTTDQWMQLGKDLDGEWYRDYFGYATDCNVDCSIIAIGGPRNLGEGNFDSGHVRIYQTPEEEEEEEEEENTDDTFFAR